MQINSGSAPFPAPTLTIDVMSWYSPVYITQEKDQPMVSHSVRLHSNQRSHRIPCLPHSTPISTRPLQSKGNDQKKPPTPCSAEVLHSMLRHSLSLRLRVRFMTSDRPRSQLQGKRLN